MADLYSLFTDVSQSRAEEAVGKFIQMDRGAGDILIEEGEVHDAMLLVESGEVTIIAGGFEVARMGPGSIIGEIGLFTHAVRTATVRAATPVTVQILGRKAFLELRNGGNPVAYRIERRAVEQLAGRLRQVVGDIVGIARKSPSMLLPPRTTTEYAGHPVSLVAERMAHALRSASAFAGAPPEALEPMVRGLEARTYAVGETLAAEDREDGPMYLLAHGLVDCVAPVSKAHTVRVATLAPGEVFNVIHHIDEQKRPFAFVAREGSSVLAMRKEAVFQLLRANHLTGSTLRTAMIRSLSDRVNQANATFALAKLMAPGE